MFRYLKLIFLVLLVSINVVQANYNDIFIADIQYDWINKKEFEKQEIISEVHNILFENGFKQKNSLKTDLAEKVKDKEYKTHYYAAAAGYKECGDYNISAFYAKRWKYVYIYALQDKKDLSKKYYYDALGNLRYVDYIEGEFPEYPYSAYQFNIKGEPVSAIYYVSKDTQYMYNPDGTFKGVWYKYNLYDGHAKVILKRTFY